MNAPSWRGRPPIDRPAEEGGFALLVALLALIGLTALATGGFLLADTDLDVAKNHRTSVEAFYAADAALEESIATQGAPAGTQSYSYTGGRAATVTSTTLLELDSGIRLYQLTSDGRHTDPLGSSVRNLSKVALFTPFPMNVPAAITAPNGLVKEGGAGTLSGFDASPPNACPGAGPAVAGVAVPPNGYVQNGGQPVPNGNPPIDDDLAAIPLIQATGIDWDALVNGSKVVPDYVIPGDPWPDFSALPPTKWPVIHVTASSYSLNPTQSGRGVIMFDGDADLNGAFTWDGILLIGGRLTSNGNNRVDGAVFTGLNRLFGVNIAANDFPNGTKSFRYQYCNVEAAKQAMGWLSQKPGSWYEEI